MGARGYVPSRSRILFALCPAFLGITSRFDLCYQDFPLVSSFVHQEGLGLPALGLYPGFAQFPSIPLHTRSPPSDPKKSLLKKRTEEIGTSLLQTGANASVRL